MKPRIEENILICPKCGFREAKDEIRSIPLIDQSGASLKIIESEKVPSAYQPQALIVPNVETTWHFGGCFKPDLLMKLQLNSIDVLNAVIHGEIMRDHLFRSIL